MTPSLVTIARRALTPPGFSVGLVAVSGGPDSMALLHVLARLAPRQKIRVIAHGIDHGLRKEAGAELDLAERVAQELGVAFGRTRVRVKPGGNLQARARAARYHALADAAAAAGATAILTAHHADDRAETVLMRLMRGAGPRGLAVLPPRAPLPVAPLEPRSTIELVRPLLRARRAAVRAYLERHDVPFATDPSNEDPRFLRVRVRREVLPLLERLAPGIVDNLTSLADQLADEGASPYAGLPRATQAALAELAQSRSPTARVWLPGGLVATVDLDAKARSRGKTPQLGAETAERAKKRGPPA